MDETSRETVPSRVRATGEGSRTRITMEGAVPPRTPSERGGGGAYADNDGVGGDGWSPRVEGEEGDPTAFDFAFGGVIVIVVAAGLLWAAGLITF